MSCTIDDRSDLLFDTFKNHVLKFVKFYEELKRENKSTTTMENLSFDIETLRKQADDKKLIRESNYREYITRIINTIMKAKIKILKELDDQLPQKKVINTDEIRSFWKEVANKIKKRNQLFSEANLSSEYREELKKEFEAVNKKYNDTDEISEEFPTILKEFETVIDKQITYLETLAERDKAASLTTNAGEKDESLRTIQKVSDDLVDKVMKSAVKEGLAKGLADKLVLKIKADALKEVTKQLKRTEAAPLTTKAGKKDESLRTIQKVSDDLVDKVMKSAVKEGLAKGLADKLVLKIKADALKEVTKQLKRTEAAPLTTKAGESTEAAPLTTNADESTEAEQPQKNETLDESIGEFDLDTKDEIDPRVQKLLKEIKDKALVDLETLKELKKKGKITEDEPTGGDIGNDDDDEPTGEDISILKSEIKNQQENEYSVGNPERYEDFISQLPLEGNTVMKDYKKMIETNVSRIEENFKGEGVTDKIVIEIAESINSENIAMNEKHKNEECTDEDYVRFIQASLNTIYFVFDNLNDETKLENLLLDDDESEISTEKKFSDIKRESKKKRELFVDTAFDDLTVFKEQGQFTCFDFVGNNTEQDNNDIIQTTFKVWYCTFNPERFKIYLNEAKNTELSSFLNHIHAITRHSKFKNQINFVSNLKKDIRFLQTMHLYQTETEITDDHTLHHDEETMKLIFQNMFCFPQLKDKTLSDTTFDKKTMVTLIIEGFPIIKEAFINYVVDFEETGQLIDEYRHDSNLEPIEKRLDDLNDGSEYGFDKNAFEEYLKNENMLQATTKNEIIESIPTIEKASLTKEGRELVKRACEDERFLNSIFTVVYKKEKLPNAVNKKEKYTINQMVNECKKLLHVDKSQPRWIRNHKYKLIPLVIKGYPAIKEAYIDFKLRKQNETKDKFTQSYALQIWVKFTLVSTQFYFMQSNNKDELHKKYQDFTYSKFDPLEEPDCIAFVTASIQNKKETEKHIEYSISNLFLKPDQVREFGQRFISKYSHYIENNFENGFFGGEERMLPGFKEHQSILIISFTFYNQLIGEPKLSKTLKMGKTSFYDKNTDDQKITLYDYTDEYYSLPEDKVKSVLFETLTAIFKNFDNSSSVTRFRDTVFTRKDDNYKLCNPIELLLIIFNIIQETSIYDVTKKISEYVITDTKMVEEKKRIFYGILRTATDALLMYLFGVDKTNVFKTVQILKTKQNDFDSGSNIENMVKKLRFFIILYLANVKDDNRMTIPALNIFDLCFQFFKNTNYSSFAEIFPSFNQLKYSLKEKYFHTYFEHLPDEIYEESLELARMGTPQSTNKNKKFKSPSEYTTQISTPRSSARPNPDSPNPVSPNLVSPNLPKILNFDTPSAGDASPEEDTSTTQFRVGSSNTRR